MKKVILNSIVTLTLLAASSTASEIKKDRRHDARLPLGEALAKVRLHDGWVSLVYARLCLELTISLGSCGTRCQGRSVSPLLIILIRHL